jgi:hypothetical protein
MITLILHSLASMVPNTGYTITYPGYAIGSEPEEQIEKPVFA